MKAIIWDMDGTITDTEYHWIRNIFRLLEHYGVPDERGLNAPWFGTATSETLRNYLASPDCRLDMTFEQARAWCRNYIYTHTYAEGAPLKPGAMETLEAMRGLGVPMCLASATERQALHYTLNRLHMGRFFRFWESTCFQNENKHQPAYFDRCAARMGVTAADCLVIEDSLYALQTGRQAGCTVWAMEDDKHIREKHLIKAAAHRYFENHAQLRQALLEEFAHD
ncbi:MAG: HAD family phosphatase [Clostridia bacterium]|nr:HAD family phosphatase [Clostridia bacterium]